MMTKIETAAHVAKVAHIEQKYGGKPYSVHLEHVVNVLRHFGYVDTNLIVSAWLHDTIEDTEVTKDYIEQEFGSDVADIVWRVTDEQGKNRKERKAKTYPKIRTSTDALIVKLSDRIANVESCIRDSNLSLFLMYKREAREFRKQLYTKDLGAMWKYLDKLYMVRL